MLKRFFDWLFTYKPVEEKPNETIEVLREQVAYLRYQNEQLLKGILEAPKDEMQPANQYKETEVPEAIQPKIIPWHVRRQMLESEDRQRAVLLKRSQDERAAAINELEGRLKVNSLNLNPEGDANVRKSESIETDGNEHQQEEIKQG